MKEYRIEFSITVSDDMATDDILRAVDRLLEREFTVGGISIQPEAVAFEIDLAREDLLHAHEIGLALRRYRVSNPKGGCA